MIRKITYIFIACIVATSAFAQKFEWSNRYAGATGDQEITSVSTNSSDTANLSAIVFEDSIVVNGTTYLANGRKDILLTANNSSGATIWTDHISSSGGVDRINDLVFNTSGTSNTWFYTGQVSGATRSILSGSAAQTFGNGSFVLGKLTALAGGGSNQLSNTVNASRGSGKSLTLDNLGNVYVLGEYQDSIVLGSSTLQDSANGEVFFAKFNPNTLNPTASARIYSSAKVEAVAITYDAANNEVVVCGNFSSTLFFNSTTSITPIAGTTSNVFIARYTTSGAYVSGSAFNAVSSSNSAVATDMQLDNQGRPVITGYYSGTYTAAGTTRTSNGGQDIFVVKLSTTNALVFANSYGGNANDRASKVAVLTVNRNVVFGNFQSSLINFTGGKSISSASSQDAFLLAIDSSGTLEGARGKLMTFSTDQINTNAFDAGSSNLYIGGGFNGRVRFGIKGTYLSKTGANDAFEAKINTSSVYCDFNEGIDSSAFRIVGGTNYHLCSGNVGVFDSKQSPANHSFQWIRNGSAIAGATNDSIHVSVSGSYQLQITNLLKGCSITTAAKQVVVDTLPIVRAFADTVCDNSASFPLRLSPAFSSSTDSLFGKGVLNALTNSFNPSLSGAGTDTIVYQRIDANGCIGLDTAEILVHPKPVINFNSALVFDYCEGDDADTLKFASSSRVKTESYSMNPAWGIKNGNIFRCDSLLPPSTPFSIRYEVEDSNGCTSDTLFNSLISLFAKPVVQLNLLPARTCKNAAQLVLSGASPSNGIFKGRGVTDTLTGNYDPSISAFASDTITYTFTNSTTGCSNAVRSVMLLDSVPVIDFLFSDTICESDANYVLKAKPEVLNTGEVGVYFSATASLSGNNLNPVASGSGKHSVRYIFKDLRGCVDTAIANIEIKNLPTVALPFLGGHCENGGGVLLNQGTPAGGQYFYRNYKLDNNILNPDTFYVNYGNDTVYYEFTDTNKCTNRAFNEINVKQKPNVVFLSPYFDGLCDNDSLVRLDSLGTDIVSPPAATGGFFSLDSATKMDYFSPGDYAALSRVDRPALTYIFHDSLIGCADTVGIYPDIQNSPKVSITSDAFACSGVPKKLKASGALSWLWSTGDTTIDIEILQDSVSEYWVRGQLGICYDYDSIKVEITPGEVLFAKDDSVSLKKGTDVTVDALSRVYSSDTLDLIGSFSIIKQPYEAQTFTATPGINPDFNSNFYYEPNPTFRRTDSVQYSICNVTCINLCDTAKVIFYVLGDPYEFIPNAFSPNGDGINDKWVVPGIEAFPENELFIYNRWGDLIYQAAPYQNEWAGQTNRGVLNGDKVVDGTYFYVLNTNDGEPLKGIIELKSR